VLPGAIIFFSVLSIIIPIWIFGNAKDRGKSNTEAFYWAIGGFFLQIIIIPIWFGVRPKIGSEGAGMCPTCKTILIRDPVCCPTCGHMFRDGVVDLSGGLDEEEEQQNISD
jgi:hypothetical protein